MIMLLIATKIGKYSTVVKYTTEYLHKSRQNGVPTTVNSIQSGRQRKYRLTPGCDASQNSLPRLQFDSVFDQSFYSMDNWGFLPNCKTTEA